MPLTGCTAREVVLFRTWFKVQDGHHGTHPLCGF